MAWKLRPPVSWPGDDLSAVSLLWVNAGLDEDGGQLGPGHAAGGRRLRAAGEAA